MSIASTPKRRSFPLPAEEQPPASHPRRRWIWAAVAFAVLLVWLLPAILAHSPLVGWAVRSATADLNGTLHVQSVSLGWFSPIAVSGVELRDPQNELVLEVPDAQGDRWLLSLLLRPSNLGRFRVEQPSLALVLRPDGSNLEDLVAKVKAKRSGTADLGLDVVDAQVNVLDTAAERRWQIDKLQLALTLPADQQVPWEASASGDIADDLGPGRFQFSAKMRQGGYQPAESPPPSNQITINSQQVPLEIFQSPIRRLAAQNVSLAGRLASAVECSWDPSDVKNSLSVGGNTSVDQLRFAAPALGGDHLQLTRLQAAGQVALRGDKMQIDQLSVTSDAGSAALSGQLDLGAASTAELLARLPQQTYQLEGRLDLARLAAMLPATLRLQEGTQITSGQVELSLTSSRGPDGMRWQGRLESNSLQAINRGRPIVWEKPIQLAFAARETSQGPAVDNLDCRSSFLMLHGSGTPEKIDATATFNLTRLAQELSGFVDLGQLRLAGDGWAKLNWKQSSQKDFVADAQVQVQSFECTLPDRPAWKEDRLSVTVAAAGSTNFTEETRLESASLVLESGSDRVDARLLEPVADLRGGVWTLEVRSQGRLETWRPRLAPWTNVDGWELGGSQQLFVDLRASADEVQVRRLECSAEELLVRGQAIQLNEPRVALVGSGSWSRSGRRIDLASATFKAQGFSAQADNAAVILSEAQPPEVSGRLQLDGDVARLQQWLAMASSQPPAWRLAGQLSCRADLRQAAGTTTAAVDATVRDLLFTAASGRRLQQPSVRLVARGTLDNRTRVVQLQQAELTAGVGVAAGAGSLALAEGQQRFDLEAQVQYDLDQISRQLQLDAASPVRVYGRGNGGFAFHGPADPAVAEGRAALSWQAADLYGFRVGPGSLEASLAGGLLNFRPLNLEVSEGKMQLAPRVQFAPGPAELTVDRGRVAEQVRINPAMCAAGLKYIAPALAGVTSAEGRFSIELDHCRIPLEDPSRGQLQGRMIVHSVEVGPGPLIHELALALGYTAPAQIARESSIDFMMADGRVHHRGATLTFPDLTVRTSGSVGLDKSLALVAEMPIPPKWRGNNVLGAALKDQLIQLPIAGTLDRPQLDRAGLEQASRQFLQNATQNVIQDQLNRLLGPRRQ